MTATEWARFYFSLYTVQVLDTTPAKENADILTPDQSSGWLIASSIDQGNEYCKSELQEKVRGDRLKHEIKFYRQTEGCICI